MCSIVTLLTLGVLNSEAEKAKMALVGKVDRFPHLLPPHRELRCEILSKCSLEFRLTATLIFAIAEIIDD